MVMFQANAKRKTDFGRMAMIYEENAPLPPPISPHVSLTRKNKNIYVIYLFEKCKRY